MLTFDYCDLRKYHIFNFKQGSMALHEYLGWEAGFTLDKESQTLALVLKETLIVFAFDNRETLMRWQVC